MQLEFTKMHGLGNDFVVIDAINQTVDLTTEQIRFLADRRFGVGCDQLLLVESYTGDEADFLYRIFNADGGEVEQCGNGARCFARFIRDKGLTDKTEIPVMTNTGKIILKMTEDDLVTVNMGEPIFLPVDIPVATTEQQDAYQLQINDETVQFGAVSMGNPHAVLRVDDVDSAPVESLGAILESHPFFPNRVNVGFLQIVDENTAKLRVFERGVGETLACGTGACAAAVIGMCWGKLNKTVQVSLPGGDLRIEWQGYGHPVLMTGPAESVFTGSIDL
jgi:diaminopimelate epimerase